MGHTSERLEKVKTYVLNYLDKSKSQDSAHGKDHLMRVYDLGMKIGLEEGANMDVLGASILLHDIIRPTDVKGESNHAIESARLAEEVLPGMGYSEQEIKSVYDAIVTSSRSGGSNVIPNTLEAKILYDADKLDGGGEVGIKRVEALWKRRFEMEGKPYDDKIVAEWYLGRILDALKTKPGFTETAKRMIKDILGVSLEYCKNILGDRYDEIIEGDFGRKNLERYI